MSDHHRLSVLNPEPVYMYRTSVDFLEEGYWPETATPERPLLDDSVEKFGFTARLNSGTTIA
jgi:hypothetical protein